MKGLIRLVHFTFALVLGLTWAGIGLAEEKGPEFKSETYLVGKSGSCSWMNPPIGMGLAADGNHLYLSGFDRAMVTTNTQTLVAKYALPPGPSPAWTFLWPDDPNIQSHYILNSMAATSEGLFLVGNARVDAANRYGVWATRSVLVRYSLNGATGTGVGGSELTIRPFFYPSYNGHENFSDILAVKEGGATFLYATGSAEAGEQSGLAAILAKFDTQGTLLWWKALGVPSLPAGPPTEPVWRS